MTEAVLPATGVIPVVGLHEYVPEPVGRPVAKSVEFSPKHKLGLEFAIETAVPTLSVPVAVALHNVALSVTVTV